jgi:hypothetical protein
MLDFQPDSAENEYGSVVGTVHVILKRQVGITGLSMAEEIFFPLRSIVGIKWENAQMYIKM